MLWSATSDTPEMRTIEAVRNDIAGHVVHELVQYIIVKSGR